MKNLNIENTKRILETRVFLPNLHIKNFEIESIDLSKITLSIVEYAGIAFDYDQIDSLITTVTRDGEFTAEFTKEINDYLKTDANIAYKVAVGLVGAANIDGVIMMVAGSDGSYVS